MVNPCTDAPYIYQSYPAYALSKGLISTALASSLQPTVAACKLQAALCSAFQARRRAATPARPHLPCPPGQHWSYPLLRRAHHLPCLCFFQDPGTCQQATNLCEGILSSVLYNPLFGNLNPCEPRLAQPSPARASACGGAIPACLLCRCLSVAPQGHTPTSCNPPSAWQMTSGASATPSLTATSPLTAF